MSAADVTPEEIEFAASYWRGASTEGTTTSAVGLFLLAERESLIAERDLFKREAVALAKDAISAPVAVEVPEIDADTIRMIRVGNDTCQGMIRDAVQWAREHVNPIPPSRLLKEGHVQVPVEEWDALNECAHALRHQCEMIGVEQAIKKLGNGRPVYSRALARLDALRYRDTEGREE